MARMIPSQIPPSAPASEKLVFEQLRKGPKNWSILHSVEVPVPGCKSPREIDFLIGIPDLAVICLEVKGGQFRVADGIWYRQGNESVENPLEQARKAMFALKDCLGQEFPGDAGLRSIRLDHAVVFTDAKWPAGVKKPPARQFYDSHDINESGGLVQRLGDFATTISRRSGPRPTPEILSRLHSLFYPDFTMHYGWALGPSLHRIDRELLEFTREQYHALRMVHNGDGSINNERVLFQGGAGTGKTMLALQLARQRHAAGDHVALVCHSPILGEWLEHHLEPGVAHVGMVPDALSKGASEPPSDRRRYNRQAHRAYQENDDRTLITLTMDRSFSLAETMKKAGCQWDYLIVDELQYFDEPEQFLALDTALKGGLANGKWAMFGDFAYQDPRKHKRHEPYYDERGSPARSGYVDPDSFLAHLCEFKGPRSAWANAIPLDINCRNTRSIAKAAGRLVAENAVKVHPSQVEGPDVVYHYWRDDDVIDVLSQELRRLHDEGVNADRIAVVFDMDADLDLFHNRESDLWILRSPLQSIIDPPGESPLTTVDIYVSIQFAGMEQDAVIVVSRVKDDGVEHPDADDAARYTFTRDMYLGMTRAKGALIVIAHESMRKWVEP